jgi:hypothetical protein
MSKCECEITFIGDNVPSEKFKLLKEAILKTIQEIDKETPWQSYEPKWWLEMMELEDKLTQ